MDNIMRISDAFGARNNEQELFLGEQTYYNTFFLISDKLVPSSAIVWAIHDELGAVGEKILTTEWKFSKPIADSIGKSAKSPNLLADKIKVEAFLYLDVANVL